MTGERLPYAPRWIRSDGLEERHHSESITRSSLVVTVKSKAAADTIMAKGLSFGGRRHEAERFWTRGEGGICTDCCGRDHFGKCNEATRYYVCAENHPGSEHRCQAENCGKKSMPCEHKAAKCANCGGRHMATSPRCPEMATTEAPKERSDRAARSPVRNRPRKASASGRRQDGRTTDT